MKQNQNEGTKSKFMWFKTPIPRYNKSVRWLQRFYIKLCVWVS